MTYKRGKAYFCEANEMIYKQGWKHIVCFNCGGHGLVCDYGTGEDFYGDKECSTCNGAGFIWETPKGRYVEYPGGHFV
jgi:hypothetical protein